MAKKTKATGKEAAAGDKTAEQDDPGVEVKMTILCGFGNVSLGDHTASISIEVARDHLALEQAEQLFSGHRLVGTIRVQPHDEGDNQKRFAGQERPSVRGSFDAKSYHVYPNSITCGLAFSLNDVDIGQLGKMAKKQGRLIVDIIQKIPDAKKKSEGDPSQMRLDGENGTEAGEAS